MNVTGWGPSSGTPSGCPNALPPERHEISPGHPASCMVGSVPGSPLCPSWWVKRSMCVLYRKSSEKDRTFSELSFFPLLWSGGSLGQCTRCAHSYRCLVSRPWPTSGYASDVPIRTGTWREVRSCPCSAANSLSGLNHSLLLLSPFGNGKDIMLWTWRTSFNCHSWQTLTQTYALQIYLILFQSHVDHWPSLYQVIVNSLKIVTKFFFVWSGPSDVKFSEILKP